jgi:hypothetical protein
MAACHLRIGTGLVDEQQSIDMEFRLDYLPIVAVFLDIFATLLAGV